MAHYNHQDLFIVRTSGYFIPCPGNIFTPKILITYIFLITQVLHNTIYLFQF